MEVSRPLRIKIRIEVDLHARIVMLGICASPTGIEDLHGVLHGCVRTPRRPEPEQARDVFADALEASMLLEAQYRDVCLL